MEALPEALIEIMDAGYKSLSRNDCNTDNICFKHTILKLQKKLKMRSWVNSEGTKLIDKLNIAKGIIQKQGSKMYHYCIIASNAEDAQFTEFLSEFNNQQKYSDVR
jgi:hypothetical protein